jgi:hypothetical protein
MRGVTSAGGFHKVTVLDEESLARGIHDSFTTQVQMDNTAGCGLMRNPGQKDATPCKRGGLAAGSHSKNKLGKEVVDNAIHVISVDADKVGYTFKILGFLEHQAHIKGGALTHHCCVEAGVATVISLPELGNQAIGTFSQYPGDD